MRGLERERRSRTSEGSSYRIEPSAHSSISPSVVTQSAQGVMPPLQPEGRKDPTSDVVGVEEQEPRRGGQRCQTILHLRQAAGEVGRSGDCRMGWEC